MSPGLESPGLDAAPAATPGSPSTAPTFTLSDVAVSGLSLPTSTSGLLSITPTHLHWSPPDTAPPALTLPFQEITLHAISRADAAPCIYCQVGATGSELRLIPGAGAGEGALDAVFAAMSRSAALCPDEEEEEEGGDAAMGGEMFTADGVKRLDELLFVPDELRVDSVADALGEARFEDADDEAAAAEGEAEGL